MKRKIAISVIVPCCNIENYVEQSILGLCSQTFSDIEIICINDGSTDGTQAKLDELAVRDLRIRVARQENSGAHHARLHGIKLARGEWIAFVDGDDEVAQNHIANLYGAVEASVGVVVCGITCIGRDNNIQSLLPPFDKISAAQAIKLLLTGGSRTCLYPCCNKLYRRDLLDVNDLEGVRINFGEDQVFNLRIFKNMNDAIIRAVSQPTYRYYMRAGSTMNTMSLRHVSDFYQLWAERDRVASSIIIGDDRDRRSYERQRAIEIIDFFGNVYRSGDGSIVAAFFAGLPMSGWGIDRILLRPVLLARWLKFRARRVCANHGWFPALLR